MAVYKAPLKDINFVLNEVLDVSSLAGLPGYEDATPDTIQAILEEAAKICENVLFPINRSGDEEGCAYENGVVRTPKGFKQAYDLFREGGWTAVTCDPEYGGQGLPATVGFALQEMFTASNQAFAMYPGLSHGAYEALSRHGSDALKKLYLPKLADGTWSGTMCLTEPHCGTDLGLLRTRAEPQADGSYAITGTKIFISAGEHDLTENILHLVLARLPDAPGGTKGISLFLVPKFLPKADGTVGERNGIRCGAVEHKMGIKANATCVMNLDGAKGWLVGELNKGMPAMFVMMNAARLGVGMQGLGIAETSYQSAVAYARDRLQGRSLTGPKNAAGPADPIIVHPDVRRMLMIQKSFTEAARALSLWVGMLIDEAHSHPEADKRAAADDLVQMLTPIIKAYFTDMGSECANLAVQTYGGHGYIRENGVEQLVRDARITQLYEGTNGIQALDLVGRKLPMKGGAGGAAPARRDERLHRQAQGRRQDEGVRRAAGEGAGPRAGRGAVPDAARHEESRRGGRGGDRPAAPDGAHRHDLHVEQDRRRRPQGPGGGHRQRLLRGQARHRALLHRPRAAADDVAQPPDQGRRGDADGPAGRGVLVARLLRLRAEVLQLGRS